MLSLLNIHINLKILFRHGKFIGESSSPQLPTLWSVMSFSTVLLGSAGFRVWLTSAGMATPAALVCMLLYAEMTLECFPSPPPQLLLLSASKPARPEVPSQQNFNPLYL